MSTSTHEPPSAIEDTAADGPAGRSRVRPHHLVIGLGVAVGLFTAASGLLPVIVGEHTEKAVSRKVFDGIPGPLKLAFYTVVPILLVWGSYLFAQRVRNWQRGGPDDRRTTAKNAKRRFADFRAGVYMQTLLRDPAAGVMHSMIYFGFLVLLAVTA